MTIIVANARTYRGDGIYVGRRHPRFKASPLANPYRVGTGMSRTLAATLYEKWLDDQMKSDTPARREIMRLVELYKRNGAMTLICWCAPLMCHGHYVAEVMGQLSRDGVGDA